MKSIVTIVAAGLLAGAFAVSADAAAKKSGTAQLQAQCQAQAKKKYSAIHFLKRRDYVKLYASQGLGAVCKVAQRKHLRIAALRSAPPRRHDRACSITIMHDA
jgi:hypothetical protein